jgi:hypothetical protein
LSILRKQITDNYLSSSYLSKGMDMRNGIEIRGNEAAIENILKFQKKAGKLCLWCKNI